MTVQAATPAEKKAPAVTAEPVREAAPVQTESTAAEVEKLIAESEAAEKQAPETGDDKGAARKPKKKVVKTDGDTQS